MTGPESDPGYPRLVDVDHQSMDNGPLTMWDPQAVDQGTRQWLETPPDPAARIVAGIAAAWPVVKFVVLLVLFVAAVGSALLMSAVATMDYAVGHEVPYEVRWAPVGLLETLQLAATFWWLQSEKFWDVFQAMLTVTATVVVTGTVSALRYGPLGLIAPVVVVGTIHAIYRIIRTRQQSQRPEKAGGSGAPPPERAMTVPRRPQPALGQPVAAVPAGVGDLSARAAATFRAMPGIGRDRLQEILGCTEHQARELCKRKAEVAQ
jgi:hypothetical protein